MIIVRRALTELKAAVAGVILETSLTRFRALIATFNVERTPSCPFGLWVFVSMVQC